jgi:hypothetical protein
VGANWLPENRNIRKYGEKLALLLGSDSEVTFYIEVMDRAAIIQSIDAEIEKLQKIRALLTDHTAPLKRGFPPTERSDRPGKRRTISAEGLANIRAAQKARWAKTKRK